MLIGNTGENLNRFSNHNLPKVASAQKNFLCFQDHENKLHFNR